MSTLNRKADLAVQGECAALKIYLKLRQKWTEEIVNREKLILPSLKPIENSNLKGWSFVRRINGQIRLREKR